MNKIDERLRLSSEIILDRLQNEQQPVIDAPDALTERIMENLPERGCLCSQTPQMRAGTPALPSPTRTVSLRWHWVAAACLLAIVGVGTVRFFGLDGLHKEDGLAQGLSLQELSENDAQTPPSLADDAQPLPSLVGEGTVSLNVSKADVKKEKTVTPPPTPPLRGSGAATHDMHQGGAATHDMHHGGAATHEDANFHYAAHEQPKDTLPYQDPACVDAFIAKFADYYNVKQGELQCSVPMDSGIVSTVYVFPDKKEIDVFGRMLQVACQYSDETPGYFLNFSHRQFFFELKDLRRQLHYRWIAERVNGKILLYGTHAPLGAETSSACYQEYRDELMNIKSINPKTREI